MNETSRIADGVALACAFIIIHRIRHAFHDDDVEAVFEDIRDCVNGAMMAAFAAKQCERSETVNPLGIHR
jgi:hypothetical protein